jgi:lipid A 3-O-deacylase
MRVIHRLSPVAATFAMAAAMALSASTAQASVLSGGGIGLHLGQGDHYQRLELAWESPSLWDHAFTGNNSRLDLVGELGVAYWKGTGGHSPNAWQLSAIPFLRWTYHNRFYVEGGIGPTVFSRTTVAGETISTAFQFGDQIGIGAYLSNNSRLGFRFSHFSNASIKTPNPGLNVFQLLYTYQY